MGLPTFWGCGHGWFRRFRPTTRLSCGLLVLASCTVVPLNESWGVMAWLGILTGWLTGCGLPVRRLTPALGFAACLMFPLFLLVFVSRHPSAATGLDALRLPLAVSLRGGACVLISTATVAILDLADLHRAIAGLPLPKTAVALLIQLVHQAALLTGETRRLVQTLTVRGLPSARLICRLRVLSALPVLWLSRLALRAERVGMAMEARGFEGPAGQSPQPDKLPFGDRLAAAGAFLLLVTVLVSRWRGLA